MRLSGCSVPLYQQQALRVCQSFVYTLRGTRHNNGQERGGDPEGGAAQSSNSGGAEVHATIVRGGLAKSTTGDGDENNARGEVGREGRR